MSDPKPPSGGDSPFEALAKKLDLECPAIQKARAAAETHRATLSVVSENGVDPDAAPTSSPDTSIVVFGSLARGEWTQGSDVD